MTAPNMWSFASSPPHRRLRKVWLTGVGRLMSFFICDGFMQATLILDSKVVKTKVFADNHDVDDLIKKCKAMVRRYDGYPFIQIKNTTYYDDKIVYDLHTFNHQSSVLEIDFN